MLYFLVVAKFIIRLRVRTSNNALAFTVFPPIDLTLLLSVQVFLSSQCKQFVKNIYNSLTLFVIDVYSNNYA